MQIIIDTIAEKFSTSKTYTFPAEPDADWSNVEFDSTFAYLQDKTNFITRVHLGETNFQVGHSIAGAFILGTITPNQE